MPPKTAVATTDAAANTAVAVLKPAKPIERFKTEMKLSRQQFAEALPEHLKKHVEKYQANLIAACSMTPKLLECDRGTLLKAAMAAAQLGLMVDPVLGHAYLVPYGNIVQLIPGYKGLIHLARQSGEIGTLYAHEVYENDDFEMDLGTAKRLVHRPCLKGDRGALIGVYAAWSYTKSIGQDGNQSTDFEFMTIADIEGIRKRSRSGDNGPWKTDYVQMARKTVIRRAAKYLPLSVQRAAVLDTAMDEGRTVHVEGGEVIIDEPIDITADAPTDHGTKATADLEARVTTTAPRKPATKVSVTLPMLSDDGETDWASWAKTVCPIIAGLEIGSIAAWEAAHREQLNDVEFADADACEAVRAALAARS